MKTLNHFFSQCELDDYSYQTFESNDEDEYMRGMYHDYLKLRANGKIIVEENSKVFSAIYRSFNFKFKEEDLSISIFKDWIDKIYDFIDMRINDEIDSKYLIKVYAYDGIKGMIIKTLPYLYLPCTVSKRKDIYNINIKLQIYDKYEKVYSKR